MERRVMKISIGLAFACLVGMFVFWQTHMSQVPQSSNATTQTNANQQNTSLSNTSVPQQGANSAQTTQADHASSITPAEIAQHNSISSCWSSINGNVYDLTSWIHQHPGGEQAILSICGIDGSSAFNAMHGGNPRQAAILVGFKIGTLAQ